MWWFVELKPPCESFHCGIGSTMAHDERIETNPERRSSADIPEGSREYHGWNAARPRRFGRSVQWRRVSQDRSEIHAHAGSGVGMESVQEQRRADLRGQRGMEALHRFSDVEIAGAGRGGFRFRGH